MIRFREKLPDGWSIGISGTSHNFVYFSSAFIVFIMKLCRIPQSETLVYVINFLTFWLIFLEFYLINSIAIGGYLLFLERFLVLVGLTVVTVFFGRLSFPYWSESDEEEEDVD